MWLVNILILPKKVILYCLLLFSSDFYFDSHYVQFHYVSNADF